MSATLSAAHCLFLKSLCLREEQFNSGLVPEDLVSFGHYERMCISSCGVQHVVADYGTLVATAKTVEFSMNHHQLLVFLH